MNAKSFLDTHVEGELNLLQKAIIDERLPMVQMMISELEYFPQIVDDNENEEGWTPLIWAA